MKRYKLDKEITEALDKEEFKSVPNVKKEIKRFQSYAKASLN